MTITKGMGTVLQTQVQPQGPLGTLEAMQEALEVAIARTTKSIRETCSSEDRVSTNHPADTVYTDVFQLQAELEINVGWLEKVKRAIAKIKAGTYGICDDCGKPIPAERLECKPEATHCRPCLEKVPPGFSSRRHH